MFTLLRLHIYSVLQATDLRVSLETEDFKELVDPRLGTNFVDVSHDWSCNCMCTTLGYKENAWDKYFLLKSLSWPHYYPKTMKNLCHFHAKSNPFGHKINFTLLNKFLIWKVIRLIIKAFKHQEPLAHFLKTINLRMSNLMFRICILVV